jgi:hypothetical protein
MPRTGAGARYPHISSTARVHDHRFCKVVQAIIERARVGAEPWGTPHPMPPLIDEANAHSVRNKLFGAKWCGQLEDKYGTKHSVSVKYRQPDGTLADRRVPGEGGYALVVIVWGPVDVGRRKVVRDVAAGKPLAYNPLKEQD